MLPLFYPWGPPLPGAECVIGEDVGDGGTRTLRRTIRPRLAAASVQIAGWGLGMARFWTSLQGNDRIVGWSRYSGGFYAPLSAAPLLTTTEYPAS